LNQGSPCSLRDEREREREREKKKEKEREREREKEKESEEGARITRVAVTLIWHLYRGSFPVLVAD